jgi:integrase
MGIINKKGQYFIDYYYQGKRVREKAGTNKRDAENRLAIRRGEILQGRYQIKQPTRVTFVDFAKEYMVYAKANKRSWLRDHTSLTHLLPVFGARKLGDITMHAIEAYKIQRLEKVKPATVNRELVLMKHMFNLAIAWGKATANPVKGIRLLRETALPERILTREEITKVLAVCSDYFRPIVLTALHTGMRKGEILGLKWAQVDLEARVITILFSKSGRIRKIPINAVLYDVLIGLKEKSVSEYVFTCRRTKLPPGEIRTAWLTTLRKSGIIHCRFHDLRHTFASHLVASGVDIVTVKELLGHADIKMTMRYAHSAPASKVKAVAALENSIGEEHGHYLDTKPKMVKLETYATP